MRGRMPGEILDTVDMLHRLVSFDTTSRNSNLPLVDWVADYLSGHGVRTEILPDPTGTKANMLATIGPDVPGGVVLSGHTDVVAVDGQAWTSDPWTLVERDGRVFGRGACDMKGFVAAALAAVPRFAAAPLARPIHLALSYDEEVGCLGVGDLVRHMHASGLRPGLCIVGEPTDMQVVNAHKGGIVGTCTVRGVTGHSSQVHRTVNAVMYASELIAEIARFGEALRAGPLDPAFDPPYSTVQVNIVKGGIQHNVVPEACTFWWEHRALPGVRLDDVLDAMQRFAEDRLLPRMRAVSPDVGVSIDVTARIPGLRAEPGSPAETTVMRLAGTNGTGVVAFGTEGGSFQEIDIPTLVIGPGNIAQAHQPDEWVERAQLDACDRFLDRVARHCTVAAD